MTTTDSIQILDVNGVMVHVPAAVAERVKELETALENIVPLFIGIGEGISARKDRVAELFYRETGVMAPGKDIAAATYSGLSDDGARLSAYTKWYEARVEFARAALSPQGGAK